MSQLLHLQVSLKSSVAALSQAFVTVGATIGLSAPAAALVIYENFPSTFNNAGVISHLPASPHFSNFTPSADVRVTSIRWVGRLGGVQDQPFRISFYENGVPRTVPTTAAIFSVTSVADLVEPQPFDFGVGTPIALEGIFTEDLGTGVSLRAGVSYQVSVVGAGSGQFVWSAASNVCCTIGLINGNTVLQGVSVAYGLYGRPDTGVIPEPASWALMIAGFGLVGGAMRRRAAHDGPVSLRLA